jgi:hypothetical protein
MPAGLAAVVRWMVAHDPADRPSSYRELREALVAICQRHPVRPLDAEGLAALSRRSSSATPP